MSKHRRSTEEPTVNAPATAELPAELPVESSGESPVELPVVVIGAGPVGLAAAAHLVDLGLTPLVMESGSTAAAAVREWSHVRLFSPWSEVTDPVGEKLLAPTGWARPDAAAYPSGGDWAEQYLQPLADVLGGRVHYDASVTG